MQRSRISIYTALAANVAIGVTKFIAGSMSRSSAMISEGVHSMVDCLNELVLLFGIYRSNKPKDKTHPFGHGRELYFWSFVVSMLILSLGAGISFYQGIVHLRHPTLSDHLVLNSITLAFSLLFDGTSFLVALKQFNKIRGDEPFWSAIINSKDPSTFIILFEDGAAVMGVLVVFACLLTGYLLKNPYFDGIASLMVGLILTLSSGVLARESRSLLMGEGISAETEKKIVSLVKTIPGVTNIFRLFSMYESPEEILLVLLISFQPSLNTKQINETIAAVKKKIKEQFHKINYIIIQPLPDGEGVPVLPEQG